VIIIVASSQTLNHFFRSQIVGALTLSLETAIDPLKSSNNMAYLAM